eukprot:gene3094-5264_t
MDQSYYLNNVENPNQVKYYLEWAIKIFEKNEIKIEGGHSIEYCLQSLSLIEGQLNNIQGCLALIKYTQRLIDENENRYHEHYKIIALKNHIGMFKYCQNVHDLVVHIKKNIFKKDIKLFRLEDENLFDFFLGELLFKCLTILYCGYLIESHDLIQRILNRFKYLTQKENVELIEISNFYISGWFFYYQGIWNESLLQFNSMLQKQNIDCYMMIESLHLIHDIYYQRDSLNLFLEKIQQWKQDTKSNDKFRLSIFTLFQVFLNPNELLDNNSEMKLYKDHFEKLKNEGYSPRIQYETFMFENISKMFYAIELLNNFEEEFNFSKSWEIFSKLIDEFHKNGFYFFAGKLLIMLTQKIFMPNRMFLLAQETINQSVNTVNEYNQAEIPENHFFNAYAYFLEGMMYKQKNDLDRAFVSFIEAEGHARKVSHSNPILIHIYSNWIPILNESKVEIESKKKFQKKLKELTKILEIKTLKKPSIML